MKASQKGNEMVGIHIRLPRELKERVEQMAKADRRSIAAQIQVLIEKAMKEERAGNS